MCSFTASIASPWLLPAPGHVEVLERHTPPDRRGSEPVVPSQVPVVIRTLLQVPLLVSMSVSMLSKLHTCSVVKQDLKNNSGGICGLPATKYHLFGRSKREREPPSVSESLVEQTWFWAHEESSCQSIQPPCLYNLGLVLNLATATSRIYSAFSRSAPICAVCLDLGHWLLWSISICMIFETLFSICQESSARRKGHLEGVEPKHLSKRTLKDDEACRLSVHLDIEEISLSVTNCKARGVVLERALVF